LHPMLCSHIAGKGGVLCCRCTSASWWNAGVLKPLPL
jgi:hypothetical protein